MKAVGWCAVLSSPESSPEKMWRQECFHRYEDRNTRPRECAPASEPPIHPPSIPQPIVLGGYCGGASPSSSPGVAVLDPAPDAERRQGGVKRRRTRELRRAVSSGAPATVAEVKDQLDVVEQTTSGFQNNCLWFSTQLAMGRADSQTQSSTQRRQRQPARREGSRSMRSSSVCGPSPTDGWRGPIIHGGQAAAGAVSQTSTTSS